MKSKGFQFYEHAGIIIPGSCFLFGLFFVMRDVRQVFVHEDFPLSALVLFLLIAYAAGHLISDVGNIVEKLWWGVQGGMPMDWLTRTASFLISEKQRERLLILLRSRLDVDIPSVAGLDHRRWQPVVGLIQADLAATGRTGRIDIINANYGMSRGIAAATLIVAVLNLILNFRDWDTTLGFALAGAIALYGMHRLAINYAKEVVLQFLQLPELRHGLVANDVETRYTVG
jgi:hypothetical protein